MSAHVVRNLSSLHPRHFELRRSWVRTSSLFFSLLLSSSCPNVGARFIVPASLRRTAPPPSSRAKQANVSRPQRHHRHFVYNEVGSVKTNFSVHFFGSVFSSPERIFFFLATKVRAVIVRWNNLSSTTHLFDSDSCRNHDYFFELPNDLGRQDAHSNGRSQPRPRNDSSCPAWEPWSSCA